MPDLKEIIAFFEERDHEVTERDLEDLKLSKTSKLITKKRDGFYSLANEVRARYAFHRQEGFWRADQQIVTLKPGVSLEQGKMAVIRNLVLRCRRDGVLLKNVILTELPGNKLAYQLSFYPGRCNVLKHQIHVSFDATRSREDLRAAAKAVELRGSWELASLYRSLAGEVQANPRDAFAALLGAVQRRFGGLGRPEKFSDAYYEITPPTWTKERFIGLNVQYDAATKAYGIGTDGYVLPDGMVGVEAGIQKIRQLLGGANETLTKIASITFKRILPGVGMAAAADHVLHAEDPAGAAAEEANAYAGGALGGAMGAVAGAAFGPPGAAFGAFVGGMVGEAAGRAADQAARNFAVPPPAPPADPEEGPDVDPHVLAAYREASIEPPNPDPENNPELREIYREERLNQDPQPVANEAVRRVVDEAMNRIRREHAEAGAQEQAYRGLGLNFMEEQLMQGLEHDPEALAMQAAYQARCRADGIVSGSAQHLELSKAYQKQLMDRRKVVMDDERFVEGVGRIGQATGEFFAFLGRRTGNRSLIHFGAKVVGGTKAFKGLKEIKKGIGQVKAGIIDVDSLGNLFEGGMAVLGFLEMLFDDGKPESNGLDEALEAIFSAIQEMWAEMRESFQHTWDLLEAMEDANVKRFNITKEYLERLMVKTAQIYHSQERGFARLQSQLDRMQYELGDGIRHLIDAPCLVAMEEVRQHDEAYLRANLTRTIAPMIVSLTISASTKIKNGYIDFGRIEEPNLAVIHAFREGGGEEKLGLMASLINRLLAREFVAHPETLVSGKDWPVVAKTYDTLVRYRGLSSEEMRARVTAEAASIKAKAVQVCGFLDSLRTPETGRVVFDTLLSKYAACLSRLKTRTETVLEEERKRLNLEHIEHDSSSRVQISATEEKLFLKLDETPDETEARLRRTPVIEWQTPIDWIGWKFDHTREPLEDAWKVPGEILPARYSNPEQTTLGEERFVLLRKCAKGELPCPEGMVDVAYRALVESAKYLYSLEENPILNLAISYEVMATTEGKWSFYRITGGSTVPEFAYFAYSVRIRDRDIPLVTAQFAAPVRAKELWRMISYLNNGSCTLVAAATPAEELRAMIMPTLEGWLSAGRSRVAELLLVDEKFTKACRQIEALRLSLIHLLKLLGIELTVDQQALLMGEVKITEALRDLQRAPSAAKVKALLNSFDLSQLELMPAAVPILPRLPTTLVDFQNFVWNLVPRDIAELALYRHMHEADVQLGRLIHDLGIMELRPVAEPVPAVAPREAEPAHDAAVLAELRAVRAENGALRAELADMRGMLALLLSQLGAAGVRPEPRVAGAAAPGLFGGVPAMPAARRDLPAEDGGVRPAAAV